MNSTERRNVKCHEHLKALGKNIKWFTLHYTTNELATSGRKKRQRAREEEEEAGRILRAFRYFSTAPTRYAEVKWNLERAESLLMLFLSVLIYLHHPRRLMVARTSGTLKGAASEVQRARQMCRQERGLDTTRSCLQFVSFLFWREFANCKIRSLARCGGGAGGKDWVRNETQTNVIAAVQLNNIINSIREAPRGTQYLFSLFRTFSRLLSHCGGGAGVRWVRSHTDGTLIVFWMGKLETFSRCTANVVELKNFVCRYSEVSCTGVLGNPVNRDPTKLEQVSIAS